MASPVPPDRFLPQRLGYGLAAVATAAASLLLLQNLIDRRLEGDRLRHLGSSVAGRLVLGEVALERFSPEALAEIGAMRLSVGARPDPAAGVRPALVPLVFADRRLARQAEGLRTELCGRLSRCPMVVPGRGAPRGVWVEMGSTLESVWLFTPLPALNAWPPDPLLLALSLAGGSLAGVLLYLTLEVQRPLRQLEGALGGVGLEERPARLAARGSPAVRQITERFNAMVDGLERASRERTTMLAGIAHDLRSPITRLRLRLALAAEAPMDAAELALAEADLSALERITRQFLVFAGAEAEEEALPLPLDQLLAETAAVVGDTPLSLDLPPLQCCVRPTALGRAVANLLENARVHGRPPLRLVLRPRATSGGEGFEIQVWDAGEGIAAEAWERARQPFQRLDEARGSQGHCGLGLAIAERVAQGHGGELVRLEGPGFGVALRGRSYPVTDPASAGRISGGSAAHDEGC
ncbi:MAG: ATP-binding protein [Cyanobacteriota bacterium]|nr:ATP-binding protein [Cyanobacteriota bacterium]